MIETNQRMGWGRRAGRRAPRVIVVGALAVSLLAGAPSAARAGSQFANDFGIGLGTVVVNLLYMPVKVVYGTLGAITGGFAYVLTGGRLETAKSVWVPSMGGTYVVTPSMLRGEDPIYFSGETRSAADERTREEEPPPQGGRPGEAY